MAVSPWINIPNGACWINLICVFHNQLYHRNNSTTHILYLFITMTSFILKNTYILYLFIIIYLFVLNHYRYQLGNLLHIDWNGAPMEINLFLRRTHVLSYQSHFLFYMFVRSLFLICRKGWYVFPFYIFRSILFLNCFMRPHRIKGF